MHRSLFPEAMWFGSQLPPWSDDFTYRPVTGRSGLNMRWGVVPVFAPPLFPVHFWLSARSLARNPLARSIPVRQCVAYFQTDLLRYVPPPGDGLSPFARLGNIGVKLHSRFLDGGNWQMQRYSLKSLRFQLAHEMAAGVPYRNTETYKLMKAKMLAGNFRNNGLLLDSDEKLDRYCEYTQWLIDSVREHGLRPRKKALNLGRRSFAFIREDKEEKAETDIRVAVDENGEFLRFNSGRHRLAVAHALGIKEVPAQIRLVHVRWLISLTREYGGPPHAALRKWLGQFRSAV